jgi:hypothetical protein
LSQRLDLTIQSVSASTGFFAMDVPVGISGKFEDLKVQPANGPIAASFTAPDGDDPLHGVPKELRPLAAQNLCLRSAE